MIAVLAVVGLVTVVAYNRAFFRIWGPGPFYAGDAVVALAGGRRAVDRRAVDLELVLRLDGEAPRIARADDRGGCDQPCLDVGLALRYGLTGPLLGST